MKQYLKMVLFIFALGALSAGLLIGVDALTGDKIEANKKFELYGAILDANKIDYNQTNFTEVFNNNFKEKETFEGRETNIVVYERITEDNTGNVSFEFQGNGMWGPIKGVMTLESDFLTIVDIKILDQEETPGLGARIGEEEFLRRFIGKKFPNINILKDRVSEKPNEILGLTGATTTTGKLQTLLNNEFFRAYRAYMGDDLDAGAELELFITLLRVHGVTATEVNVNELLNETFEVVEEDNLKLYVDNVNGLVSFIITEPIRFAENGGTVEDIPFIITLEKDKETVRNIVGVYLSSDGHWGKVQFLDDLDASGAKFPNIEVAPKAGTGNIDGGAGVTATRNDFATAINKGYDDHLALLQSVTITGGSFAQEFVINKVDIENAVLAAIGKEGFDFASTVVTLIDEELYVDAKQRLVTYVVKTKMPFGHENEVNEDVAVLVTVEEDGVTIHDVRVIYEKNNDHFAKEILFDLNNLVHAKGVKLPNVKIVSELSDPVKTNELLIYISNYSKEVEETAQIFQGSINLGQHRHQATISQIDFDNLYELFVILEAHGYETNLSLQELYDLFDNEIVSYIGNHNGQDYQLYINGTSGLATYVVNGELRFGNQNNPAQIVDQDVTIYMTLASDFLTILDIKVLYPEGTQWGKTRLLTEAKLAELVGMKFPNLSIHSIVKDQNDNNKDAYLGVTGVTVTGEGFETLLNESYDFYYDVLVEELEIDLEKLTLAKLVLGAHGYDLAVSFDDIFETFDNDILVKEVTKDNKDYVLYINKVNNKVTYLTTDELTFGNQNNPAQIVDQEVDIYVTLASDFITILNVTTVYPEGTQWGKTRLMTEAKLAELVGMKFPNLSIHSIVKDQNDNDKDAYLGVTGVTVTGEGFEQALNNSYDNLLPLIQAEFIIETKAGKTFVKSKHSNNISFYFTETLIYGNGGTINDPTTIFVTLENDFDTIVDVSVAYAYSTVTQWGKERLLIRSVLSSLNGSKMSEVKILDEGLHLGIANVTFTGGGFESALQSNYQAFKNAYQGGNN